MTKVDNIEKTVDVNEEQVKETGEAEKNTASEVVKTRKPRRKNRSKEEIAAEKKAKADRARARAEAKAKRESEKKDMQAMWRMKHLHEGDRCKYATTINWAETQYQDGNTEIAASLMIY